MNLDSSLLEAALVGYQARLAEIDRAMADLRRQLKGAPSTDGAPRRQHNMSAAARRRIAAAQRKRWAAYKKAKAAKK